jgi:hypothetical protein
VQDSFGSVLAAQNDVNSSRYPTKGETARTIADAGAIHCYSTRGDIIMKAMLRTLLVGCALTAPALALAQSNDDPVTRAEVRADLVRVEQAGYRPVASDPYYPSDIQAAEAKVAAQQDGGSTTSVGGVAIGGSSGSGAPLTPAAGQ